MSSNVTLKINLFLISHTRVQMVIESEIFHTDKSLYMGIYHPPLECSRRDDIYICVYMSKLNMEINQTDLDPSNKSIIYYK